ncbi:hypothetical protein PIB30_081632, partial [Stylosanthes scabra]|nr:hypothetical protein [Stylosanthes scabra]
TRRSPQSFPSSQSHSSLSGSHGALTKTEPHCLSHLLVTAASPSPPVLCRLQELPRLRPVLRRSRELPRVVRFCVVAVSPSCVAIVWLKLYLATRQLIKDFYCCFNGNIKLDWFRIWHWYQW